MHVCFFIIYHISRFAKKYVAITRKIQVGHPWVSVYLFKYLVIYVDQVALPAVVPAERHSDTA